MIVKCKSNASSSVLTKIKIHQTEINLISKTNIVQLMIFFIFTTVYY